MKEEPHPLAPHYLPGFITAPGESDVLFTIVLVLLLAAVLIAGSLYFQIHSLPERMAHRAEKTQLQVVAVLCLIALFTHNHLFWIAALLLALVRIPDFTSPLARIAEALEQLPRPRTATAPATHAAPATQAAAEPPKTAELEEI